MLIYLLALIEVTMWVVGVVTASMTFGPAGFIVVATCYLVSLHIAHQH